MDRNNEKNLKDQLQDYLVSLLYNTGHLNYDSSIEVANYLIAHGIVIHFLPENTKIYRIVNSNICDIEDYSGDYHCNSFCDECAYCHTEYRITEGRYSQLYDDMEYKRTVFKTFDEAQEALNLLYSNERKEK